MEVARPVTVRPRSVVVPKPELEIDIWDGDDVPKPVVGVDVPIESDSESDLNDQMLDDPSDRASCAAVEDDNCSNHLGVVVPIPV